MATSKLQRATLSAIVSKFTDVKVKENFRPDWLTTEMGERCELDIYIPKLRVAVEVQGTQHFTYVEHFHGCYENYLGQVRRDEFKKATCARMGIELIEVHRSECLGKVMDAIYRASADLSERNRISRSEAKSRVKPVSKKSLHENIRPLAVSLVRHMASCGVPQSIIDAAIEVCNDTGRGRVNAREKRRYIMSLSMFFSSSVYGKAAKGIKPIDVIKAILEIQDKLNFKIFTRSSLTYYMRMHVNERVSS